MKFFGEIFERKGGGALVIGMVGEAIFLVDFLSQRSWPRIREYWLRNWSRMGDSRCSFWRLRLSVPRLSSWGKRFG